MLRNGPAPAAQAAVVFPFEQFVGGRGNPASQARRSQGAGGQAVQAQKLGPAHNGTELRYLHSLVYGHHTIAGKIVTQYAGRGEAAQAGALQLQGKAQAAVLRDDAKVSEHATGFDAVCSTQQSREGRRRTQSLISVADG
jgi:hypothetical protein